MQFVILEAIGNQKVFSQVFESIKVQILRNEIYEKKALFRRSNVFLVKIEFDRSDRYSIVLSTIGSSPDESKASALDSFS